jgi:hypothetical protein
MAETFKTLTRPILVLLLTAGWIAFIGGRLSVPATYEAITVAVIAEWALERGYKRLKE